MSGKRGLDRLFCWVRARSEREAIDAADVGTAFGMELSIDAARKNTDKAESAVPVPPDPVPSPALRKPH